MRRSRARLKFSAVNRIQSQQDLNKQTLRNYPIFKVSANFNLGDVSKNVPGFSRVKIHPTFDKENSSLPWFEIALDPFNVNFRFNGTQIENFSETKLYQKLIVKKFWIPLSPIHRKRLFQAFVGR